MQVLGDLVELPSRRSLPLPWWHRAPLGLQSGTKCYVALVENATRAVPDVVASVLDFTEAGRQTWLRVVCPERHGVVRDTIALLHDMNIALAESATLEGGSEHQVTVVCEALAGRKDPSLGELKRRFKKAGLPAPKIRKYQPLKLQDNDDAEVQNGWIENIAWCGALERVAEPAALNRVDLTRAVISADTGSRLLRFVFPMKGSRTVRVKHRDEPGVLKLITDEIHRAKLNILSLLLRRGGMSGGNAMVVAVCEPPAEDQAAEIFDSLVLTLNEFPQRYRIRARRDDCLPATDVVAVHEFSTRVIRAPEDLRSGIRAVRSMIPPGRPGIFLSYRHSTEFNAVVNGREVRDAINDGGGYPLIVKLNGRDRRVIYDEVIKHLWAADAGVVFLPSIEKADNLGRNVPHELGFIEGQRKSLLILVERGSVALEDLSNISGTYVTKFAAGHRSADRTDPESIYRQTRDFIESIVRERRPVRSFS